MKKLILSSAAVLMGTCMIIAMGCDQSDERGSANTVESSAVDKSNQTNDFVYSEGVTQIWTVLSESGTERVYQVAGFEAIKSELHDWEIDGYVFSPNRSFVTGAYVKPDTNNANDSFYVELVTLVMNSTEDFENEGIFIEYFRCEEFGSGLRVSELSFVSQTDEGWEGIDDGLWVRSSMHPIYSRSRTPMVTSFWSCWSGKTLGGCLGGAVRCALSGPGWAGCTGGICAGAAVGFAAYCGGQSLGWWS